jgi:hypothetical protein
MICELVLYQISVFILVGGLFFFHILGIIIPTDEYVFRGVETTNQNIS